LTKAGWFFEKEIGKMETLLYVKEAIEDASHKKNNFLY